MEFNYFDCPIYRQLCEEYLMRSPSPFDEPSAGEFNGLNIDPFGGPINEPYGGAVGGTFGGPTSGPFGPSTGGYSPQTSGMPTTPPPASTPSKSQATKMTTQNTSGGMTTYVSAGSLVPCLYRFVYLWLTNGKQFWIYLTYLDSKSAAGFYWTGFNWAYFGIDLDKIDSFFCY